MSGVFVIGRVGFSSLSVVVRRALVMTVAVAVTCLGLVGGAVSHADDDWYTYNGSRPLASYAPGDVLKTREIQYHILSIPTPLRVTQVVYRSTGSLDEPVANVTSIVHPPTESNPPKVVSYQSFYDSLNVLDSPSRIIGGGLQLLGLTPRGYNVNGGSIIPTTENGFFAPLLAAGITVVIPDTQGQQAAFVGGPFMGRMTLDSLRAARQVPGGGVPSDAKTALMGYSGGAVASNWAAIEGPRYAPDVNKTLIGVAQGGLLVDPAHNLRYIDGSLTWAGIVNLALAGLGRSFQRDFTKYLTDYGRFVYERSQDASIMNAWGQYPLLRFAQLVKPEYANPSSIPEFVDVANRANMYLYPNPTVPMFIGQAAGGLLEGTLPGGPGIGPGDGVMIAGDVQALARKYCDSGVPIQYDQYDLASHIIGGGVWLPGALKWIFDRFADSPLPNNCNTIPVGNDMRPEVLVPAGR